MSQYTNKCTISFIDLYRNTTRNVAGLSLHEFPKETQKYLAKELAAIAHSYGLLIDTCAEGIDLAEYGIEHGMGIDFENEDLLDLIQPWAVPNEEVKE